jgi:phenylalanyl-tRNA synthetase beta chain
MIISVNWLKKFTDIDLPIDELATLIGARLVEIEDVIDLGAKYAGVVIAKVVQCKPVEGSDHLSVTKLDDGGKTPDVERDENGLVQVVCGAPNIREGLLVAWLPPGSTVPSTVGAAEPFVLGARALRGVTSNGMIASARELALYDEHEGILELDVDVTPGDSFADVYELNDYLLDIENKSLTHRPDTFGIIGFAREVAAIAGKSFHTPDWFKNPEPQFPTANTSDIAAPTVTIDNPELSSRYQAVVLSGADGTAKSPLSIQTYLARVGVRPISAAVDVTNYLMMLTGQPLHAFDYDKLVTIGGGKADIHVRAGRDNETLKLLDGRTITLTSDDIVIAAGETAVALAGAMGGADTEIDANTKNIIVESATFNLYNLRTTQMRHGIFSEAITRFTKGQPAEITAPVLAEAIRLLGDHTGARVVSPVVQAYPGKRTIPALTMKAEFIDQILGSDVTIDTMIQILERVEFDMSLSKDTLVAKHPYWRSDIHIAEDIVEEIGRINGFDIITPTLPARDFTAVRPPSFDQVRTSIRQLLTRAGANEVLTYSFVHGDVLTRAAQKLDDSYRITNSLSPSLQYYRQTLTPSLLGLVHPNIKQGYDNLALYELNKTHPKTHGMTDEGVPGEADMVALVIASKTPQPGSAYYRAKKMLDYLGASLGLDLVYTPIDTDPNYPVTAPFEYRRSALVTDKTTDTFLGIVGEYKKSTARGFKLPEYAAGFEISTTALALAVEKQPSGYTPISRYPSSERDICFQVATDVTYGSIVTAVLAALDGQDVESHIVPVDIYQPDNALTKNITIRLTLTSHQKTLKGDDVAGVVNVVIAQVQQQTNATVI